MGRCPALARAQVVIAGIVVLQTFMLIVNTARVPARAAFPERCR
jgi:hypothetical protein